MAVVRPQATSGGHRSTYGSSAPRRLARGRCLQILSFLASPVSVLVFLNGFLLLLWIKHSQSPSEISSELLSRPTFYDYKETHRYQQERAASLEYLKSFQDTPLSPLLGFFHIPKTAGTAVEEAAGVHTASWGSCLFPHKPKRSACQYPNGFADWPTRVGWWHLPRWVFPIAGADPYHNHDLFAVIRNPYDRMVSEFYYVCGLRDVPWRPNPCDTSQINNATYMNEWIYDKVTKARHDAHYFLEDNGHFVSQYEFLFGPFEVRMMDHVLVLEDMQFDKLMEHYQLPFQLEKHNAVGAASRGHLTMDDLAPETLQAIHVVYQEDFFGTVYERRPIEVEEK